MHSQERERVKGWEIALLATQWWLTLFCFGANLRNGHYHHKEYVNASSSSVKQNTHHSKLNGKPLAYFYS